MRRCHTPSFVGFIHNQQGAAAAEFALLALLFITMMLGIIDMARYAWEFNSAKAGTRAAARLAIVTSPVVNELVNYDAVTALGLPGGSSVPVGSVPTYTCTSGGCGAGTLNATRFNTIVARVQDFYPQAQAANVVIRYEHEGLGVAGNPYGPDVEPLVTVSLTGLTFQPVSLQIFGVNFSIPAVSSTFSGEDLA
jgi:Flp pilus assembly protein TadG